MDSEHSVSQVLERAKVTFQPVPTSQARGGLCTWKWRFIQRKRGEKEGTLCFWQPTGLVCNDKQSWNISYGRWRNCSSVKCCDLGRAAVWTSVVNSRQMAADLELGARQGFVLYNYRRSIIQECKGQEIQEFKVPRRDERLLVHFLETYRSFFFSSSLKLV